MVLDLVHEFHMDSYRILWLLNTDLIQEDINHMDRNILGNCMLYCDELFLTLILGLSVKEVGQFEIYYLAGKIIIFHGFKRYTHPPPRNKND